MDLERPSRLVHLADQRAGFPERGGLPGKLNRTRLAGIIGQRRGRYPTVTLAWRGVRDQAAVGLREAENRLAGLLEALPEERRRDRQDFRCLRAGKLHD